MSWTLKTAANALRNGDPKSAYDICTWGLRERYYEWAYGIESSHVIGPADLGVERRDGHHYEPTSYLILNTVFGRIKPRNRSSNEVFLDVGCGMGRTVLAAATYPYAAVIGIEISEQLLAVARRNVARSRKHRKCGELRLEHADASAYRVPDEVTTIFFYNPFHGEPMQRFMESTRQSLLRKNRRLGVTFVEPAHFNPADYPWITVEDEIERPYPGRENGLKVLFCQTRV